MKEEEKLPNDSRPETRRHIQRVQHFMAEAVQNLLRRAEVHDASKLESPEREGFDGAVALKGLTYGSPEYFQQLESCGLKAALEHHYQANDHHPEHHKRSIAGMSLLALVEMLADWRAATERHADGNLAWSIEVNMRRFGYTNELRMQLHETARELGWLTMEDRWKAEVRAVGEEFTEFHGSRGGKPKQNQQRLDKLEPGAVFVIDRKLCMRVAGLTQREGETGLVHYVDVKNGQLHSDPGDELTEETWPQASVVLNFFDTPYCTNPA